MDLSDEEVLLEPCCFLLTYHQEQIKRKSKMLCVREIFKKEKANQKKKEMDVGAGNI